MTDQPKLEGALTVAISSEGLQDLMAEYAELGLDAFLESDAARDIPIVSTIVGFARLGVTLRDRLFLKKAFNFLGPISSIPKKERAAMGEKLENDPAYGRKFAEHVIELLERIEAHRKPRMMARVFLAYNAGEIDATMLHRLAHAVERLPTVDIPELRKFHDTYPPNAGVPVVTQLNLSAAGLAIGQVTWDEMGITLTPVADAFLRLELDRQE